MIVSAVNISFDHYFLRLILVISFYCNVKQIYHNNAMVPYRLVMNHLLEDDYVLHFTANMVNSLHDFENDGNRSPIQRHKWSELN